MLSHLSLFQAPELNSSTHLSPASEMESFHFGSSIYVDVCLFDASSQTSSTSVLDPKLTPNPPAPGLPAIVRISTPPRYIPNTSPSPPWYFRSSLCASLTYWSNLPFLLNSKNASDAESKPDADIPKPCETGNSRNMFNSNESYSERRYISLNSDTKS